MIEKHNRIIRLVATTTIAKDGIELIEDYKPDVVFLDISMPGMNGFELLEKITFKGFKLVFTTAHKEYALQAIKNKAFDYLLKPIDENDLSKCLNNIVSESANKPQNINSTIDALIEVQVRDGIIFIKQKDIVRLEASGSYTTFHVEGKIKHFVSKNMKEFEMMLDPAIFYRCHKSHIVNLNKVEKFVNHQGFFAQMSDGSKVEISRRNKDSFLDRLKNKLI